MEAYNDDEMDREISVLLERLGYPSGDCKKLESCISFLPKNEKDLLKEPLCWCIEFELPFIHSCQECQLFVLQCLEKNPAMRQAIEEDAEVSEEYEEYEDADEVSDDETDEASDDEANQADPNK